MFLFYSQCFFRYYWLIFLQISLDYDSVVQMAVKNGIDVEASNQETSGIIS